MYISGGPKVDFSTPDFIIDSIIDSDRKNRTDRSYQTKTNTFLMFPLSHMKRG